LPQAVAAAYMENFSHLIGDQGLFSRGRDATGRDRQGYMRRRSSPASTWRSGPLR